MVESCIVRGRAAGARISRDSPRGSCQGLTLLEIVVALAMLSIGASAALQGMVGVATMLRAGQERASAFDAARNIVEQMQSEEFVEVCARYNSTPADDPAAGASPGSAFDVGGLTPRVGDPDGRVGEILFPGGGLALREDAVDTELGMPRDLNGDELLDSLDHSGDYRILPARVRVSWRGVAGDSQIEIAVALSNDKNVP